MKDDGVWAVRLQKLGAALGSYKYIFLVILAGIILLIIPGKSSAKETQQVQTPSMEPFDLTATEHKLEDALSQLDGAGRVTVVLTVKSGSRQILAQDGSTSEKDGASEATVTTVVISKGSGTEEPVTLQQLSPEFQGALVVCSGGNDPSVRLSLVEAVSALTGLGADRISVCQGK